MSASAYARIAERYQVPASDDEAIERFFLDVATTLSREEREAIVAELLDDERSVAPAAAVTELPAEVPTFSIEDAPSVSRTSALAKLVGELSATVEMRVIRHFILPLMLDVLSVAQDARTNREWLSSGIVYVDLQETVRDAVRRMTEANAGIVAVCDHERLVGVLWQHDIIKRVVAAGLDPNDTAVASVMTRVDHEAVTPTR